jgi:hypothetical protein
VSARTECVFVEVLPCPPRDAAGTSESSERFLGMLGTRRSSVAAVVKLASSGLNIRSNSDLRSPLLTFPQQQGGRRLRGLRRGNGGVRQRVPDEPTLGEVWSSPDVNLWLLAMEDEHLSLIEHGMITLVPRPAGVPFFKGKLVTHFP